MSDSEFTRQVRETFETGMKLKRVMLKKKIRWAKTPCPRCGGWLHGRLAGKRDHLHMSCEGRCGMDMME